MGIIFSIIFLRLWALLVGIGFVASFSDYFFQNKPHNLKQLLGRLVLTILWPFAIFSTSGRSVLFGRFKDI